MTNGDCSCHVLLDGEVSGETRTDGGTVGVDSGEGGSEGHWLDEQPATEAPLPAAFSAAVEDLYGAAPLETLDDWADAIGGGGDVSPSTGVEALCHAHEPTPHRAHHGDETYHFLCFFDAVVLAYLTGDPVDLRTESPGGEVIEAHVSPDEGIEVEPSTAALSFGVAENPDSTVPEAGPAAAYSAVCPYVRAFPDREGYERWAPEVDALTVGLPLPEGLPFAATLVR